jgi:hypothetical protein
MSEGGLRMKIVIVEVGSDYVERVDTFDLDVSGDESLAIAEAIRAVAKQHAVLPDDQGGCTEYVSVSDGEDYIAVTVTH